MDNKDFIVSFLCSFFEVFNASIVAVKVSD